MQHLRNNPSKLQPKCPLLNSAVLTIMLLNTRNLHYHFQDLLHSPIIQHADVIVLQETFLCPTDRNLDYQLSALTLIDLTNQDHKAGDMVALCL